MIIIGILGGGVPPSSPNPAPNSDQKISIFHTPFQGQKCDMKLRSLLRSEREQKDVLKIIPLKTIPDSTPKWAKTIPVFCFQTETVQKPYPLGRHIPYMREYPRELKAAENRQPTGQNMAERGHKSKQITTTDLKFHT